MPGTSVSDDYQSCSDLQDLALPFLFDDANIIIRAEGVDFAAHRFILSRASPFFKDMFSLPRGATTQEGIPVIEVEESAQTFHDILSFLYLNDEEPTIKSFFEVEGILLAIHKYSMETLEARFHKPLGKKALEDPIGAFDLACKVHLPDLARFAARCTLTWDFETLATHDSLRYVQFRTPTFLRLLKYHRRCAEVAAETIKFVTTLSLIGYEGITNNQITRSYSRPDNPYGEKPYKRVENEWIMKKTGRPLIGPCPVDFHAHRSARDRKGASGIDCREWWSEYIGRIQTECKAHPLKIGRAHV